MCHEFPTMEGVENKDKSVLMNIDFLIRNANIKRHHIVLPGDTSSTIFSELSYSTIKGTLIQI